MLLDICAGRLSRRSAGVGVSKERIEAGSKGGRVSYGESTAASDEVEGLAKLAVVGAKEHGDGVDRSLGGVVDAVAEAATDVFAALLVGALLGWSPEQLMDVSWASTGQPFDEMAARVISPDPQVRASWEAETSGYIVNGLRLAVHGLLDFPSFKDATLAIANMGGDSDTNAAIYGQLGGAFYGIEAIPASWRERVYQGEEIDQLARDLVDLRLEPPVTRFDEDLQGETPSSTGTL